jgi:predicted Zn-dependent protease
MSELRLGHQDSARHLLEDSFRHVQDKQIKSETGADLVSLDYQSGDLDHAVDMLRELLRAQPPGATNIYMAYRVYSELAARQLATLAATAPDSAEMHQVLAQAAASQDNFTAAIAQYRQALASNPELPEVHYELGQMVLANSQAEIAREEAEKEFNLSLAGDPANAYAYYMLGEIAWMRSKPMDALAFYEHSLSLSPGLVDAHIAAGKALNALNRPADALAQLQAAVRLEPRNEVAHYRLAQTYGKLGRTEDADREQKLFRELRDSHEPLRALYQQVQERTVLHQTIEAGGSP